MKKNVLFVVSLLLFATFCQAQSLDKLFKKYANDSRFEYTSMGKGWMKIASFFTDYSEITDGMMSKITGLKILELENDSSKSTLFISFKKEIEQVIENGNFETSVETRSKENQTYIYKRVDNKANADILIFTKDKSDITLVWLKGKMSPEEMEKMRQEKEREQNEEQQDNS